MIRFTLRQFRNVAVVSILVLVVLAVILAITGVPLVHLYDSTIRNCKAQGDCKEFLLTDRSLYVWLGIIVLVAPGIIGVFWGAPLVAGELENGTFRLAWSQSVTRTRWMVTKLGVVGLAAMASAALLSLMVTWWASPLDRVNMDLFGHFDERGIVAIGYAAFAFSLGVTAGILIRKTLPAMAVTLVAFVFARLAFVSWIRPNLFAPAYKALPLDPVSTGFATSGGSMSTATLIPAPPFISNAWVYSTQIVDKAGHALTHSFLARACPLLVSGKSAGVSSAGFGLLGHSATRSQAPAGAQSVLQDCVAKVGATFHELVTYQPASRYWPLQWYEMAIFLGAAVILAGFSTWWVRRRLT
ncbi:MAG: transporter [Actinomycetota bacterium]|nr:MAG: transporter [Actinomycetota bacterium]